MKNKSNPLAIGMFVLAAAAISVASIMILGAAKFFRDTQVMISYFSEGVNGLDVGAPVKYKGVVIGKVEDISILAGVKGDRSGSLVSVVYTIDLDTFKRKTGGTITDFDKWISNRIRDGLRARLNYQSIVTGMLYVELDYFAELNEAPEKRYEGFEYMEIPGSSSGLSELSKAVEKAVLDISKINFKNIGDNLESVMSKLNGKLDDVDVKGISDSANLALSNMNAIMTDGKIKESLSNLNRLLVDVNDLVKVTQGEIIKLSNSGRMTMGKIDNVLVNLDGIISPRSPFRYELAMLLKNLNASSVSISNLLDYLQRNPNSLLTGKEQSKESK